MEDWEDFIKYNDKINIYDMHYILLFNVVTKFEI